MRGIVQRTAQTLTPPPKRFASEWAEQNRVLPPGSAEPGPWRSERVPWTIRITAAIGDPRYRRIVGVCGSQTSKTETLLNYIGHRLDDDPVPMLYVGPTKSNVDGVIEPRLVKMLRSAPALWRKTMKGKGAQKLIKRVNGVECRLGWAGSATELASQPAGIGMVDEYDRMDDIKGEGSVLELIEARLATYPDSKLIVDSTPTVGKVESSVHPETGIEHWDIAPSDDVMSPIWRLWQEGTRHEWAVPCLHCDEYFVPRFKLLSWPEGSSVGRARRLASLVCPRCGSAHGEKDKPAMNGAGELIAPGQRVVDGEVVGDVPENDTFSFWVSGLMSPWVSFGQRAAAWLRAVDSKDIGRIQAQINTSFGELYMQRGDAPSWEVVKDCAGEYSTGDVPKFVQWLFLTVDVQKNRLEWVLRGWGAPEMQSSLIEEGTLMGETDKPDVWEALDGMVEQQWGGLPIKAIAVDSGYRADEVYNFVSKYPGRAFACHGKEYHSKLFSATPVEVNRAGRTLRAGTKVWTFDANHFKSWVHGRIQWPADETGAWLVPEDVSDDYCKQVTAEALMTLPSGRQKWVKTRMHNHKFDCEVLQALLAQILNVRSLKPGGSKSGKPGGGKTRPRKSSWMNGGAGDGNRRGWMP